MMQLFDTGNRKSPRRKRPPNDLWDWVEVKFFSGHVAAKQATNCGDAVKLFTEKGLGVADLEKRCRRHEEMWPRYMLTLRSLMTHIDDLAKPTQAERDRAASSAMSLQRRNAWLLERQRGEAEARSLSVDAATRCRGRGHKAGTKPDCQDCKNLRGWRRQYGWSE